MQHMNQIRHLQSKQPQLTTYLSRTTVSDWYAPIRISGKHTLLVKSTNTRSESTDTDFRLLVL